MGIFYIVELKPLAEDAGQMGIVRFLAGPFKTSENAREARAVLKGMSSRELRTIGILPTTKYDIREIEPELKKQTKEIYTSNQEDEDRERDDYDYGDDDD